MYFLYYQLMKGFLLNQLPVRLYLLNLPVFLTLYFELRVGEFFWVRYFDNRFIPTKDRTCKHRFHRFNPANSFLKFCIPLWKKMVFSLLLCIVNNNNNNNNILYKVYSILASYNGYIFTILISFCYSSLSYVFFLYVYGYTVQYSNNILSSFIQCNNAGLHSEFPPSPSSPFPHPPPLPSPSPSHLYPPI